MNHGRAAEQKRPSNMLALGERWKTSAGKRAQRVSERESEGLPRADVLTMK